MEATATFKGHLSAKLIRPSSLGLRWKLNNYLHWTFFKSFIGMSLIRSMATRFGLMTAYGKLEAVLIQSDGTRVNYGLLSYRVITNAGVEFLVDDWDNDAQNITNMNFHDSGTGVVAEAVTDVDLGTPAGPATRATGTKSQPAANQLRTVGTISYTSALAITEHGIFADATRGAPDTLWDRSVFAAINVANGDSIQFTYTCTVSSGG